MLQKVYRMNGACGKFRRDYAQITIILQTNLSKPHALIAGLCPFGRHNMLAARAHLVWSRHSSLTPLARPTSWPIKAILSALEDDSQIKIMVLTYYGV